MSNFKIEGIPDDKWLLWKRKRRNTFLGFILIGIMVGIDCSVIFSTLYLYLKDLVKAKDPEMYYGVTVGCFYLTATVSGVVFGRWLDKTRRVRAYVNITLLVQILGFVLYVIPYHPAFLVVGRSICGVSESFTTVVTGEIFRINDEAGSTRAVIWLGSVYSMGFLVGPSINFAFRDIHFRVGTVEINKLNFVGIFMIASLLVVTVIVNFLVHDCSAEIDLKRHLKDSATVENNNKYGNDVVDETSSNVPRDTESVEVEDTYEVKLNSENEIPITVVLRSLFSNIDTFLILVSTFIFVYVMFSESILLPLIVTRDLKWSLQELNGIYAGAGGIDFLFFLFTLKCFKSSQSLYLGCIGCISIQTVVFSVFICFRSVGRNLASDIIMIVIYVTFLNIGWWFDDVFIRVIFGKMIPSKIQSFSEGLRSGMCKLAIILSSFTVSIIFPFLKWWSAGMLSLIILIFIGYIIRRKHLITPKELPFSYKPKQQKAEKFETTDDLETGDHISNPNVEASFHVI